MEGSGNNDEVNDMDLKKKKMIPPIVVTVLMILYYVVYFTVLVSLLEGFWKYLLGVIPFVFSGVTVMVCLERIKEIKEGEEDDLSKY